MDQQVEVSGTNHNPCRQIIDTKYFRQFYSAHLTIGDRLVSNIPYLRPLVTITGDSLHEIKNKGSWGVHDILGTRCDPYGMSRSHITPHNLLTTTSQRFTRRRTLRLPLPLQSSQSYPPLRSLRIRRPR